MTAALQDGKTSEQAQYLTVYVRNRNPLLRTVPLAAAARVDLLGTCEEPASHLLGQLARDARGELYYFTLTVQHGAVQRIEEHQAVPAC